MKCGVCGGTEGYLQMCSGCLLDSEPCKGVRVAHLYCAKLSNFLVKPSEEDSNIGAQLTFECHDCISKFFNNWRNKGKFDSSLKIIIPGELIKNPDVANERENIFRNFIDSKSKNK